LECDVRLVGLRERAVGHTGTSSLLMLPTKNSSLVVALVLGLASCRRHPPAPTAASASASASASAAPGDALPAPRCHGVDSEGMKATLGAPAPVASSEEGDDGIGLPFSPEIGGAAPVEGGFLVGALEQSKEGTSASLILLSSGQKASKRIDLGRVHGDVLAPRAIARGGEILAVVPDGAPNGSILRIARIADPAGDTKVTWGPDLPQGSDESDAFAVEPGDKGLLAVWDEWDVKEAHSVVKSVVIPAGDVSKIPASNVVSNAREDSEAPALTPRPGGYWAAWITNVKREPDKKERSETSEAAEPVDMGPRWITVAPLDTSGKPSSPPVAITSKTGHVQGFDLASGKDGNAIVVWREDTTSPATPGGAVRVALVRGDGSVDIHPVDDDDVGAGVPALFVDENPPDGTTGIWLSLVGEAEASRLAALDAEGRVVGDVVSDPSLGVATPLVMRGGQVLVARPRGRGVSVEVLACQKK
jgi:hypothetical protein